MSLVSTPQTTYEKIIIVSDFGSKLPREIATLAPLGYVPGPELDPVPD